MNERKQHTKFVLHCWSKVEVKYKMEKEQDKKTDQQK